MAAGPASAPRRPPGPPPAPRSRYLRGRPQAARAGHRSAAARRPATAPRPPPPPPSCTGAPSGRPARCACAALCAGADRTGPTRLRGPGRAPLGAIFSAGAGGGARAAARARARGPQAIAARAAPGLGAAARGWALHRARVCTRGILSELMLAYPRHVSALGGCVCTGGPARDHASAWGGSCPGHVCAVGGAPAPAPALSGGCRPGAGRRACRRRAVPRGAAAGGRGRSCPGYFGPRSLPCGPGAPPAWED